MPISRTRPQMGPTGPKPDASDLGISQGHWGHDLSNMRRNIQSAPTHAPKEAGLTGNVEEQSATCKVRIWRTSTVLSVRQGMKGNEKMVPQGRQKWALRSLGNLRAAAVTGAILPLPND